MKWLTSLQKSGKKSEMKPVDFKFKDFNDELVECLVKKIASAVKCFEFGSFALGCRFPKISEVKKNELRKGFQFKLVKTLGKSLGKKIDFEEAELFFLVDFVERKVFFKVKPVFVFGKYNKFSRQIAQTFHYCPECKGKGCKRCSFRGKVSEESVQELIVSVLEPSFKAESNKFHGSGREDKDVLMLGSGRPFVLELIEPKKRRVDLKKLEKIVNKKFKGKIAVSDLRFSSKDEVKEVKAAKNEKIYSATVECMEKVNREKMQKLKKLIGREIKVEQRTPLRVSKRRVDLTRKHIVEIKKIKLLNEKSFEIKLKASSGLYIKEFVSGDENRTRPSISSLLNNKCVCKQLDVLKILH